MENTLKWHVCKHAGSFHAQKSTGSDSWSAKIVAGPFAKRSEAEEAASTMRKAIFAACAAQWAESQRNQPLA
jgi:hypothetical protein